MLSSTEDRVPAQIDRRLGLRNAGEIADERRALQAMRNAAPGAAASRTGAGAGAVSEPIR